MQKILEMTKGRRERKRFDRFVPCTLYVPPPPPLVLPRRGNDAALQIVACTSLIGLVSEADASCAEFRELSDHAAD